MEGGPGSRLVSWMMLPVSAVLVLAALSMSRQPYTGITLREDRVVAVVPGSPADLAGFAAGDRLIPLERGDAGSFPNPIARAVPGRPLDLLRERAGMLTAARIVPRAPPESERRMLALLLAVACGFVVVGGWVWSERRDGLTRPFHLLCLAFAVMLAPAPRLPGGALSTVYEVLYAAATLFVPALFVHFFSLFPGARRLGRRSRQMVRAAYAVSASLLSASLAITLVSRVAPAVAGPAASLLQTVAGLWFAAGLLTALLLFLRAYGLRQNADARRRLRVALAGTVLGAAPLAAVIAIRTVFPTVALPGERASVGLALLIPLSFAWATAVHRVFEFRIALRAGVAIGVLALAGASIYGVGEWVAAVWRADLGSDIAGGALACLSIVASTAGPVQSGMRRLGARLVPSQRDPSLAEWVAPPAIAQSRRPDGLLLAACDAVRRALRLDACGAWWIGPEGARVVADPAGPAVPADAAAMAAALPGARGPVAADDPRLPPAARQALAAASVAWLLPVGDAPRALLHLGRRLGGPWLSIRETRELESLADHLDVLLENAALRDAARNASAMDRELSRAGAIQARLLSRPMPRSPALDCAAATLSCEAVGGDYWDVIEHDDGRLTIAIGDAAGKGIPAAIMGVWAQATLRSQARRGTRPGRLLASLNRELVALEQPQSFVALLCAEIDPARGELRFANAGVTPPLLRRADARCRALTTSGVLLGVLPGARYADGRVALRAGDLIVFHTDGLTEARRGNELFGMERLQTALEACASEPATEIVRYLIASARAFADHPLDDVTVVAIRALAHRRAALRRARPSALKWEPEPADSRR